MVTKVEVEEFHRLGNIPYREITKSQVERCQRLYEKVYGKQVPLTEAELRTKIKQKPLNRKTVEECFQKISRVSKNNTMSSYGPVLSEYPNRVYELGVNFASKDGVGIEIVHEFCHILYGDGNCIKNGLPSEHVIENYARDVLEKDPGLPNYILNRLKELGKLVD